MHPPPSLAYNKHPLLAISEDENCNPLFWESDIIVYNPKMRANSVNIKESYVGSHGALLPSLTVTVKPLSFKNKVGKTLIFHGSTIFNKIVSDTRDHQPSWKSQTSITIYLFGNLPFINLPFAIFLFCNFIFINFPFYIYLYLMPPLCCLNFYKISFCF